MKSFAQPKSSRRREPRAVARDVIVGHTAAKQINRGACRLIVRPVTSRDHRRRYGPGQELTVRAYANGPAWCTVRVAGVQLVAFTTVITLQNARLAGHRTSSDLQEAVEAFHGIGRKDRLVWALTVALIDDQPRLLAAAGGDGGSYQQDDQGRWIYVERTSARDTDHGYTSSTSRALHAEPEALSEADWRTHVQATRDMTHEQWVALSRAREQERLQREHADRGRRRGQARKAA